MHGKGIFRTRLMVRTRPHSTISRYDPAWALSASLLLHALPILVLGSISNLDLTLGQETRFDFVWLTPSTAPSPFAPGPPEAVPNSAKPGQASLFAGLPTDTAQEFRERQTEPEATSPASLQTAPEPPAEMVEPAHAPPSRHGPVEVEKKPPVTPSAALAPPRSGPAPPVAPKIPAPPLPAPEPQKAPAKGETSATAESRNMATTAAAEYEPLAPEQETKTGDLPVRPQGPSGRAEGKSTDQAQPRQAAPEARTTRPADPGQERKVVSREEASPVKEKLSPKPVAAVIPPAPALPNTAAALPAAAPTRVLPDNSEKVPRQLPRPQPQTPAKKSALPIVPPHPPIPVRKSPSITEEAEPKHADKPPETRGAVVASIHGDLKLVIAGNNRVKLQVFFREYPKTHRHRVQTRSEARRAQRVVPLFARAGEETTEAVIGKTGEGIYVFSAESERGEATTATFTLKIFEAGSRERVTPIGTRTVSGRAVLTRVLMPDGIVWEDDGAFTGSLEDSDSITKFNSRTGVYWKEYNE